MNTRKTEIGTVILLVVLAWGGLAAAAPTDDTYAVTLIGTYTPEGLSTLVDVYKLTVYNNKYPGCGIGAIQLTVGRDDLTDNPLFANIPGVGTHIGSGAFQAALEKGRLLTPSLETAAALGTDTNAYKADTHFLIPSNWLAVLPQMEGNDLSLWDGTSEVQYGLGSIAVICAPPPGLYVDALDVLQIGVVRGETVYADLGTWEKPTGQLIRPMAAYGGELIAIHLPEPGTMALLAMGALAALRRRR